MMKRLLDRHEWAVDIAAAVLCASALAHAYTVALERPRSPAPPAMVIATAEEPPRDRWGIARLGAHAYEIDRSRWDWPTIDTPFLTRSARIVPEIRDGQATGFRLFSLRSDGLLVALGFRNGDVIRTVNGLELSSPEKALQVYATIKSAEHFVVGFEHEGQPQLNEYWLR